MRLACLAALLLVPAVARPHDFWLEPEGDALVLRYGHRGGELLPVDRAKLRAARCATAGGTRDVLGGAAFSPREVRIPARCDVASVLLDGGVWSVTPDGEVNLPKNRVEMAVRSWASRQLAKWIEVASPRASAPLGDELELVPATDLAKAHAGDKATFKVLSRGKPVPDAVVAMDHHALGETDSDGTCRIKLRSSGRATVSATLRRRIATPEADDEVLEASLTFEVAP